MKENKINSFIIVHSPILYDIVGLLYRELRANQQLKFFEPYTVWEEVYRNHKDLVRTNYHDVGEFEGILTYNDEMKMLDYYLSNNLDRTYKGLVFFGQKSNQDKAIVLDNILRNNGQPPSKMIYIREALSESFLRLRADFEGVNDLAYQKLKKRIMKIDDKNNLLFTSYQESNRGYFIEYTQNNTIETIKQKIIDIIEHS